MTLNISRNLKLIISVFGLISLTALVSLFQLISIPADPKNSILFGFSLQRLIMIGCVFLIFFISFILFLMGIKQNPPFKTLLEKILDSNNIFWSLLPSCTIIAGIGLPLLFRSPESFGEQSALYIRFRPFLQLVSLVSLQTVLAMLWIRLEYLSGLLCQIQDIRINFTLPKNIFIQTTLDPKKLFGIGFGLGLFLIAISLIWLPYHQIGYFLFYKNPWLGWGSIICSIALIFIFIYYHRFILRLLSILSLLLMLGGIIININQFNHINWFSVPGLPIERLKSNSLTDLFYKNENFHVARYSLFSILAGTYPQYTLVIDKNLLKVQKLNINDFVRFSRMQSIEIIDFEQLTDTQMNYLLSLKPIDYKIFVKDKIRFYFLPAISIPSDDKTIIMRRASENEAFVYPSQLELSFP